MELTAASAEGLDLRAEAFGSPADPTAQSVLPGVIRKRPLKGNDSLMLFAAIVAQARSVCARI